MTKEKGILFTKKNRDGVRSEIKLQTRRTMKPQPVGIIHEDEGGHVEWGKYQVDDYSDLRHFARYQVGDLLYMREPYQILDTGSHRWVHGRYVDDDKKFSMYFDKPEWDKLISRKAFRQADYPLPVSSSLFMYKSLARKWVKVTGVRCERVQDITHADILREGINAEMEPKADYPDNIKAAWIELWNSINAKPKPMESKDVITHYVSYPWDDSGEFAKMKTYRGKPHKCYPNPWNFAYTFELTKRS
ncbi:hypothetical protein KAR91_37695 [Candidatus Pacearchaeota archaeon]|nr:hypothetical protein [Candidatus Pacearchaeota archaeon]